MTADSIRIVDGVGDVQFVRMEITEARSLVGRVGNFSGSSEELDRRKVASIVGVRAIDVAEALLELRRTGEQSDRAKMEAAMDEYLEATGRPRTIQKTGGLPVEPAPSKIPESR